ncbi:MAG: YjbQ family protein [Candidatus Dadabacteria bacterium]|nr:MAG: YjbQ family protein [Candidatus Dadabacteria bacterium]
MSCYTFTVNTKGQGLYEITSEVFHYLKKSGVSDGLCILFIPHTSASLVIQENADPSARYDLEQWINRFIPENDPHYTHTLEGSDDMPSHIKSALTEVSLSIPIADGELMLGTWQGIYLWEHRRHSHKRKIIVKFIEG